jgi:hypothetical protein
VFIDINVPDETSGADLPAYLRRALADLRAFEGRLINGRPLPRAYLFVTNSPWHHHLEAVAAQCCAMAEGFQILDFKLDAAFPTLRAAIDARERHIEMHELVRSMRDHSEIPSTFDGEIPEFAFGDVSQRLLVGQRYSVTDGEGVERIGLLTTATVMDAEEKAYCALSFDDGTSAIYSWSLSQEEMAAWHRHPDTFFGVVGQRTTKARDPLELYDFILSGYKNTPKERLLEFMAGAPDITELRKLDQPVLASIYAERCVNGLMRGASQTS